MKEIKIVEKFGWIWLLNMDVPNPKDASRNIKGKYLFYSKDKEKLIELAKSILKRFELLEAKVPSNDKPIGEEFVLCIYDNEPKFKEELRKYADEINIKYRYWKSNDDTLKGKYSKEFLNKLPKKERNEWTKNKVI